MARASTATSRLEDDWERFSAEEGSENELLRLDALSSTGVPSQQAVGSALTEYGDSELADARRLIEKIVALEGTPTTEVAELRLIKAPIQAIEWLIACETEALDALQAAIEPTGREGGSEAIEHLLEHLILRKQAQIDFLTRASKTPS